VHSEDLKMNRTNGFNRSVLKLKISSVLSQSFEIHFKKFKTFLLGRDRYSDSPINQLNVTSINQFRQDESSWPRLILR